MPWKECSVMDERLRFVAKLLDGESMTEVCQDGLPTESWTRRRLTTRPVQRPRG
jgi:hypothetical protein